MNRLLQLLRHSLSLKLSFTIVLLAVPIFIASLGIIFVQSRHQLREEAKKHAASVLHTTLQRVNRNLETVATAADVYEWLVIDRFKPDSLLQFTARIVMLNPNVSGCSVTAEPNTFEQYGRYFSAYTIRQGDSIVTVREAPYEYFDKVWYATPRQQGHACWVDPFDDYTEGTLSATDLIASYCKPLYDHQRRFIGVMTTDLSLNNLSKVINTEQPYPHAYFTMIGRDGRYFVHPDTALITHHTVFGSEHQRRSPELIALGHEMTTGHEGVAEVEVDGKACFVCYKPVPGTSWSLALVCPEDDVLGSFTLFTRIIIPLIIVGLLLIVLLSRRIVAHNIRPLNRLLKQAQCIAAGNYSEQIPHTRRIDAVGRLQNSFATMQESIDRHIADIEQMNTEMERRNHELAAANRKADEAARQKAAFIQNVTHQIRTPLNIIMGFSQVLRDNARDMSKDETKSMMDMMKHNVLTLNRMILMLYDSSDNGLTEELSSKRHDMVACNDVARQSIDFTYEHFPKLQITFTTTLPDTFRIHSNELYLMRSLREILYNSAKYSDGKHVSIHLTETPLTVRFILEDTGKGISEQYRQQVFEPFLKVDDLSEGLGLGLPLTKRHIENLGGSITLDVDYQEGCRFIIDLPK